jgi:hypothetical protein
MNGGEEGGQAQADSRDLETLKAAFENLRTENLRLRDARSSLTRQLGPLPISAAAIAGLISAFPGGSESGDAHTPLLILAAVAFALMIWVSSRYSKLKPYRALRDDAERHVPKPMDAVAVAEERLGGAPPTRPIADPAPKGLSSQAQWYLAMIRVEERVRDASIWAEVAASAPEAPNAAGEAAAAEPAEAEPADGDIQRPVRILSPVRRVARWLWSRWPPEARDLQHGYDQEWQGLFLTQLLFAIVVVLLIAARLS